MTVEKTRVSTNNEFPDQRLAVFVDVHNLFYAAKHKYGGKVDYGTLLDVIEGERKVVRAFAYTRCKEGVDNSSFIGSLKNYGYDVKEKIIIYRDDEGSRRDDEDKKNSWEVEVAIDALAVADKVDVICLVTGEGSYTPLAKALRMKGCRVEVYGISGSVSSSLVSEANQFIPIPEEVIFKMEKKDAQVAGVDFPAAPEKYGTTG